VILFRSVQWKNFLSTGDNAIRVQLDRSPTTLIVGQNGAGKSTLLDALSFSLFGKAHRDINKNQLINTINGKGLEVIVEFDIGSHSFKIVRGVKPTKFEIYQNGNLLNQEAAARDYQKYLEQNILKLNHKSFHQIVVLGSSSFVPFMQLPAYIRREVIEDLLDIQVFSKMNQLLKERNGKLKEEIVDATYNFDLLREKVNLQRKYIRDITEMNEEQARLKQDQIDTLQVEINELQDSNATYSDYIAQHQTGLNDAIKRTSKKRTTILQYEAQFTTQIGQVVKDAKFYEENHVCPTCTQDIGDDIRTSKLEAAKGRAKELQEAMVHATEQSTSLESDLERLSAIAESIREKTTHIHTNNQTITRLQGQIRTIETDIVSMSSKGGDLDVAQAELDTMVSDRDGMSERKLKLLEERTYNDAAAEMLKDTGIKTKIVKEYLPVMNNLVNKYLQVLDFFVSFHLDENFNEIIKSRHRDNFNYASFSEGEKQRIDLALLFTWRQIARMKNSTSTNLLVLDETFDSSLDQDGVDNLMKILGTLENDTNVFVISHKGDLLDGKFRSKIVFEKEHNFSVMAAER
jgi:DNA repair exonuclease SbcCD ATPase subunit